MQLPMLPAHSLTAAFVFWGQRAFIEYLLQSPNRALGDRLLGDLLAGTLAGATGLSNAMKFLSGIEALQVTATRGGGDGWNLDGRLPWVTNLRKGRFRGGRRHRTGERSAAGGGNPFRQSRPGPLG